MSSSDIQVREILAIEVRLMIALPRPFAVVCATATLAHPIVISTSRILAQRAKASGAAVVAPASLECAAWAAQHGRFGPSDWRTYLQHPKNAACGRIGANALGGADGLVRALELARRSEPATEPQITLGAFLEHVATEARLVVLEGEPWPLETLAPTTAPEVAW